MNFKPNSFKFSQYLLMNNNFKSFNSLRDFSKSSVPQCFQNPYMEKYATKIAQARKMNPEKCKEMHKENFKQAESNAFSPAFNMDKEKHTIKEVKIPHFQKQKDLDQIMKLESMQEKTVEEIEMIWKEYHRIKDGVYAVLPKNVFEKMFSNFKEYPIFLFPLPRAQGYEFIMCQFFDQSCYFTSLINYQAFKENAPICLTITYFTEFEQDKEIVLMRGEYDSSLKASEAQCLANQLQLYYGGQDGERQQLLYKFNKQPNFFKHTDLISNFELSLQTNFA